MRIVTSANALGPRLDSTFVQMGGNMVKLGVSAMKPKWQDHLNKYIYIYII